MDRNHHHWTPLKSKYHKRAEETTEYESKDWHDGHRSHITRDTQRKLEIYNGVKRAGCKTKPVRWYLLSTEWKCKSQWKDPLTFDLRRKEDGQKQNSEEGHTFG